MGSGAFKHVHMLYVHMLYDYKSDLHGIGNRSILV